MIQAKFRVTSVDRVSTCSASGEYANAVEKVMMSAVTGKSEANKRWSKYTPNGQLTMQIDNPEAMGQLKPGQCYRLDFNEAGEDD
jgi:hypothetical protein